MDNLNILFIIPVPLFPLGASNYNSYRRIKKLCQLNFSIILICPGISRNHQAELEDFQKVYSIKVLDRLKVGRGGGFFKHVRHILHNRNALKTYIEKSEISLIHCVNPPDLIPLIASKLAYSKKIPFLFHIADPGPESMATIFNGFKKKLFVLLSNVIEKRVIEKSSGIITVNNFLKNQIIKTRSISENNFEVVYNLPETVEINISAGAEVNNSIVYIGTLHSETIGLRFFIENYKKIKNWDKTKLFIVGDGNHKKDLMNICKSQKFDKNIVFKGHLLHQQAMQILSSSTLAIIPYQDTPLARVSLPTKLFEYIKLSKVVICPNLPGFTEVLGPDNPGLYDINNKLGVYNTIQTFFDDKMLVEKTKLLNSEIAKQFTLEKEIRKITDFYRQILN